MITQEDLVIVFTCDPDAGHFYNRYSRGRAKAGARAGSSTGHGYRRLTVGYERIYEHQAIWLFVHGEYVEELDHKDGDKSNNSIHNLRPATRSQNNYNSVRSTGESGLRGAYMDHRVSKWYSKIQVGGQVMWLGHFDTAEEAHAAFMVAVDKYQGEFALHNRNLEGA